MRLTVLALLAEHRVGDDRTLRGHDPGVRIVRSGVAYQTKVLTDEFLFGQRIARIKAATL